jgi:alkylated DNA repair dioxygenase AlkB
VPVLEEAHRLLCHRYGVEFDSGLMNLYRDGNDSVAWHRDKIPASVVDPIVVILSVGEPRTFRLRPRTSGRSAPSHTFRLGHGDLLVTGGTTQRTWDHTVPKVASAGPRISITMRHS